MQFSGEDHPGTIAQPSAKTSTQTQGFTLNHSMLRVKDPKKSLAFYTGVLGMKVMRRLDFAEMKFSLYFLTKLSDQDHPPTNPDERTAWTFSQRGVLELTHNWGSEEDDSVSYHDGNAEPQGFGHICFSVPDLEAAVAWFDEHDVIFVKRPEQGSMQGIAFIKDPDGYWIEIVQPSLMA